MHPGIPVAKDPLVYRVITPDDWAEAQRIGHVPSVEVDRVDAYPSHRMTKY